jgi:hypothetical protein
MEPRRRYWPGRREVSQPGGEKDSENVLARGELEILLDRVKRTPPDADGFGHRVLVVRHERHVRRLDGRVSDRSGLRSAMSDATSRPTFASYRGPAYASYMDASRRNWVAVRACVLLLVALVVVCAADLTSPVMAMADGGPSVGSACETQVACGQPGQPQVSSGFPIQFVFVALPVSEERLVAPVETGARTVDRSPSRLPWKSLGPLAPRSPPTV